MSAFACDPVQAGEPYVGWNWMGVLSQFSDVTVLTRSYHREAILASEVPSNVNFVFYDLPFCSKLTHRWKFIKPYYLLWQFCAFLFLKLKPKKSYDIVHHVTYNAIDSAGFLWALDKKAAFVWGPVGGGQSPPEALKKVYGKAWGKQKFRRAMKTLVSSNPFISMAVNRKSHVFFANQDTQKLLIGKCRSESLMLETALRDEDIIPQSEIVLNIDSRLKICWVGRLEARKGLPIVLDAIEELPKDLDFELLIIGDGPEKDALVARLEGSALRDKVCHVTQLERSEVLSRLKHSDMMLFSSVQDTSGNVVIEALGNGVPVVALNHQGSQVMLRHGGGVLIDINSYSQVVSAFRDAIVELDADREKLKSLSEEALRVVKEFQTWDSRRDQVQDVYNSLVSDKA
jgi:glycosyltransferase involved in cell wall biosynthesis